MIFICSDDGDVLVLVFFFFYCYGDHRDLHSFPTRRSSDLSARPVIRFELASRCPRSLVEATSTKLDRKSTRLNSSHVKISYAVFCLKKKKKTKLDTVFIQIDITLSIL